MNAGRIKNFIKYSSFNVLGMIGLSCYILADTFFVSKGLGTNGLAALNLAIPVYSFIHGSGLMIGMGAATKYSIQRSRKENDTANRTFTNAVYLAVVFAVLFMFIGIFFQGTSLLLSVLMKMFLIWRGPICRLYCCFLRLF